MAVSDTRAELRQELTERRAEIDALIEDYRPHEIDSASMEAFRGGLDDFYAASEGDLFTLADDDDPAGFATHFQENVRPMITAFVEPFTAESSAQAATGAQRAAEGAANARSAIVSVVMVLTIGILASAVLAFWVTRSILRDRRSPPTSPRCPGRRQVRRFTF